METVPCRGTVHEVKWEIWDGGTKWMKGKCKMPIMFDWLRTGGRRGLTAGCRAELSVLITMALASAVSFGAGGYSELVYPGAGGYLIYRPTEIGDRVLNFSTVGYAGGGVAIPDVTALVSGDRIVDVAPAPGDDYWRIQNAIDQVSDMELNEHGFRGVVQLAAGAYEIDNDQTLKIRAGGVVLRCGSRPQDEAVLTATGTGQKTLLSVSGSHSSSQVPQTSHEVIDKYVPVGAASMRLDSTANLHVGDKVIVHRRCNDAWISEIGMDRIPDSGDTVQWKAGSYQFYMDRVIVGIDGNRVFLNAPVVTSIDQRWDGGRIYAINESGRLRNVGIENLRAVSQYDGVNDYDPDHYKNFITLSNVEDSWVRNVTGVHFSYAVVSVKKNCRRITVCDCSSLLAKGPRTGGWRYPFGNYGQFCLFEGCYSEDGRHDYVNGSRNIGPGVFYDCIASRCNTEVGPHHRWASGYLYDNVDVSGGGSSLAARNRGNSGTGHGWSGANMVFWNCQAPEFKVESPFTAQNWVIGGIGTITNPGDFLNGPLGIYDSHGSHVALGDAANNPNDSLYIAQLNERLAEPDAQFREYWVGDFDGYAYDGTGSDDDVFVNADWLVDVEAYADDRGWVVEPFDKKTDDHLVPFTFTFALKRDQRVAWAVLTLAMQRTGGRTRNDSLWIEAVDDVHRRRFEELGLGEQELPNTGSGFLIFEFLQDDLANLQDGELNLLIGENEALDWATLNVVLTTRSPGDINKDGAVNAGDLEQLAGAWLTGEPSADIAPTDGDGVVNFLDFAVLAEYWPAETAAGDPNNWQAANPSPGK